MRGRNRTRSFLYSVLAFAAVLFVCVIAAGTFIAVRFIDNEASRREYARLRVFEDKTPLAPVIMNADADGQTNKLSFDSAYYINANPDFYGWLYVEGTKIDYPVARGADNIKYLDTSFMGNKNRNGSVFLDYRCIGEYTPHLIMYGHNAERGEMFGELPKYLNASFMAENPVIIISAGGIETEYAVFAARDTDIFDPAYRLDFTDADDFAEYAARCGAPAGANKIITLSTCVNGPDKNKRVIVQGAAGK